VKHIEHEHQCAVIKWAEYAPMPGGGVVRKYLTSIAGERPRTPQQAGRALASGLTKGFPDLFLFFPVKPYHGLFIELKRPANKALKQSRGQVTEAQRDMLDRLRWLDYGAVVAYGAKDAIDVIENYLWKGKTCPNIPQNVVELPQKSRK